jgi:calcineurin-like phosphoesterase family protein
MNVDLLARYNSLVAHEDEVWMLGDLVMGDKVATLDWVDRCAGRKTMVVGNHDSNFRKKGRAAPDWDDAYAVAGGLRAVLHGTRSLKLSDGTKVLLSHFPYVGDSGDADRYASHRPADDGSRLLHGHVHEKWRQRGRQINVGVDAWGGYPVAEQQILDLIAVGPRELSPLEWV